MCIALGGQLAVEYDMVTQFSLAREAAERGGTWWIGLRRSYHSNWLSGKRNAMRFNRNYQSPIIVLARPT